MGLGIPEMIFLKLHTYSALMPKCRDQRFMQNFKSRCDKFEVTIIIISSKLRTIEIRQPRIILFCFKDHFIFNQDHDQG